MKKKLIYLAGLIAPGIAIKAIAQDMTLPTLPLSENTAQTDASSLTTKEKQTVRLYSECSDQERAVFLYKVLSNSSIAESITNDIIINNRIDEILRRDEEGQRQIMLEEIRRGGMRWGKIGEPTDRTL